MNPSRRRLFTASVAANIILAAVVIVLIIAGKGGSDTPQSEENGNGKGPALPGAGRECHIQLKNAIFCWNDSVCIDADRLTVKSMPEKGAVTDMDRPDTFALDVCDGSVRIGTDVLGKLMNERVFGLPGSSVKDVVIDTLMDKGKRSVRIRGKLDFIFWMDFEMTGTMSLNESGNFAEIRAESVRALGLPFAGSILDILGVTMEKLVSVPVNRCMTVRGNSFEVNPFALFREPSITGTLDGIHVGDGFITARFKKMHAPPPPERPVHALNDILLYGGRVRIGRMLVSESVIQMVDADPSNPLRFNIKSYFRQLSGSVIRILEDGTLLVRMVDAPVREKK